MAMDRGETVGAVVMDLSKSFDCISHDLQIAKLGAYGFEKEAWKKAKSKREWII